MSRSATGIELVKALRESPNEEGESEFDRRYRPVLFAFARKVGLEPKEAEELVARILAQLIEEVRAGGLEVDSVPTCDWLFASAGPRIADASLTATELVGSEEELEKLWRSEWRRQIIRQGLDELYATSAEFSMATRAFELHTLERRHVNDVAAELNMSRSAVFSSKNRLMDNLREIVAGLEERY